MRLLREYIRQLLTEAAKGPTDLPEGTWVQILSQGNDDVKISYVDNMGEENTSSSTGHEGELTPPPYGEIMIEKASSASESFGECGDAYMVTYSEAEHGWGPLLYDVAMEWATLNGGGVIGDRTGVSGAAHNVWNYYLGKRGDVKSHQLDDLMNTLTPDIEEDNCEQRVAGQLYGTDTGPAEWVESPLSKRYTKSPTTMRQLDQLGRLIEL